MRRLPPIIIVRVSKRISVEQIILIINSWCVRGEVQTCVINSDLPLNHDIWSNNENLLLSVEQGVKGVYRSEVNCKISHLLGNACQSFIYRLISEPFRHVYELINKTAKIVICEIVLKSQWSGVQRYRGWSGHICSEIINRERSIYPYCLRIFDCYHDGSWGSIVRTWSVVSSFVKTFSCGSSW